MDDYEEWEVFKNFIDNFDWQCYVCFCWEEEQQVCKVDIFDMVFDYGFEYQGIVMRLVFSLLMDKCFVGFV